MIFSTHKTTPSIKNAIVLMVFTLLYIPFIFSQTKVPFNYTASSETFTVPCGVHLIHVKVWGAGGSGGGSDSYPGAVGGAGACVESDFAVTPGQVFTVIVGGGAGPGSNCTSGNGGGSSGFGNGLFDGGNGGNAGGSGCSGGGGGGGGGSGILDGSTLILVAGGGGGGSGGGQHSSGATGGGGGVDGNISPGSCSSPGISGGSSSGSGLIGANKGGGDGGGGGGGGGGYLGSTGGGVATGCDCGACGGGGGTSFSSGTNTVITNGSGQTPGNGSDTDRPAAAAIGGSSSTKGGDGFIEIVYTGGPPENDFTSTTVCHLKETVFSNSTTSPGAITGVEWTFGDNSPIDTTSSPHHVFPDGGTYNVQLITHNSFGCSDTITKPVQVYYTPTASFTFADVCYKDSTHFGSTSTINSSSSISSYLWNFGDGSSTSNLQAPAHVFSVGTYTTQLIVTSPDMCADTTNALVNTFDPPTSVFNIGNTCLFDSAKSTNTSLNPTMGTISSWAWNFGDGTPVNTLQWSPHHLYSAPGDYNVTLITVSSNLGCSDTLTSTVTVYPMPVAEFTATDVCLNQPSNFHDTSTVANNNTITGWSWDFGGGLAASSIQNPSRTYTSAGTYTITLIASTNNNCKDTVSHNVTIHPLPQPNFTPINVCDGSSTSFTSQSTINSPDLIASTLWVFGDGNFVVAQDTGHLYSAAGTYNVTLQNVSTFGCVDSITKAVVINPNPVVNFIINDSLNCSPLCVSFTDSSHIATGNNINWAWDFGDGGPLNYSSDVYHCYYNNSIYTTNMYSPSLTVTSDSGCVSTTTKTNLLTAFPNPVADFIISPITTTIVNPLFTIKDQSAGADIYHWTYGDGDSSILNNPPAHTYADTGKYTITLITITQFGCVDTASQQITVDPDFVFYIPNAFTPNEDGINDSFGCQGVFITEFKMSIFDRWGNLIYTSDSMDKPWDGKANNGTGLAQQDVYIYSIRVKDFNKKEHQFKGTVTLVK